MLLAVLASAGPVWAQECPPNDPDCGTEPPPPPPPGGVGSGGGSFRSQSSSQGESQSHSVVSSTGGGGGAAFGFPAFYVFPFGYYFPVF